MLHGKDIICLSSIDWDFIWQGHQEVMSTLARHGNRVLFVENTGVRSPALRDLPRIRQRLRNWRRGFRGFRQEAENLVVHSPLIAPLPYSRLARVLNRTLLLVALRRWMRATRFGKPIVWTFLPTPLARDLIAALDPELVVYYCIDDLASSSPGARRVRGSETRLFAEADLVFVTSARLRERAAEHARSVHLFPFGVNYPAFERARLDGAELPADLRALPRPVVGYVGGLHQWVDQDLLATVSERLPDVTFALVGPAQTDVERLAGRPNVHLLGARRHADLPAYIKGFDVGIVPYRLTDYTANVYPTKLNEYLAMGIPVVATDLTEIRRFNTEHGDVVAVAGDANAFADAIRHAIEKAAPADAERRIDVARENSWETRIARMSDLMEQAIVAHRRRADRWDRALRRAYRHARRRAVGLAAGAAATYALLFHTPLPWVVAAPLRMAPATGTADAIVVFAGGAGESGKAGSGYQERVKEAVDLYRAGRAPNMVFSTGYAFEFPEAEVMRDLAVAHGVPPAAIVLETEAASTYENVLFTRAIAQERGWRRVLLVSSPYHMRRAVWTWRRIAADVAVAPSPVARSEFYSRSWGASTEQIAGIVHEYVAIAVYWWRGWL